MRIWKMKKSVLLLLMLFLILGGMYAQNGTPDWNNYFSINAGVGTNFILMEGLSVGLTFEPKYALSPLFMVGVKGGLHFSFENEGNNIIALESQGFFRWNFLRLGGNEHGQTIDIFAQGGIGFLGAFRGTDVKESRSSPLFDLTAGVTIPLGPLWHIEPSIRGGYPFLGGASITVGRRFNTPQRVRELPPVEIITREFIDRPEYIIFASNNPVYNDGIDRDGESLNELAIIQTARILRENPDFIVRIEGHANPVTNEPDEPAELLTLSTNRANQVAAQLRTRGVPESQIVIAAHGGTRTIVSADDYDRWNMNRRVELIIVPAGDN